MSKTTIEVDFSATVKAVLREDDLSMSLSVSVPYGSTGISPNSFSRSVSVSQDSFSPELQAKVRAVLQEVKEAAIKTTLSKAMAAAQQASNIAAARSETI